MNDMLTNLLRKPIKDKGKNAPKFNMVTAPNIVHQADLLYLPEDRLYKYLLVVIDDYSRLVDAEPLKTHDSKSVAKAFGKIYTRKGKKQILKMPYRIEVDSGSEFKSHTLTYFKNNNIAHRVAVTGRHRQQALVERANQSIQKLIFYNQAGRELLTGEQNKDWIDDLPDILKLINDKAKKIKHIDYDKLKLPNSSQPLLKIGSKVRVILEEPRNAMVDNVKLHGRFRTGDQRWNMKPRVIRNVILMRGQPPLYNLNDPNDENKIIRVGYTRNQLQLINPKEKLPDPKRFLKNKQNNIYFVEKIIKRVIKNKKPYYEIKWRAFPSSENTLESEQTLKEDVPKMLSEFKKKNNIK